MKPALIVEQAERILGIGRSDALEDVDRLCEGLTPDGMLALMELYRVSDATGRAQLSVDELAGRLDWRQWRSKEALTEIRRSEYVLVERKPGHANVYVLPSYPNDAGDELEQLTFF